MRDWGGSRSPGRNGSEAETGKAQDGCEQNSGCFNQMIQRMPFALNYDPAFTMDLNRLIKSIPVKSKTTKVFGAYFYIKYHCVFALLPTTNQ